MKQLVKYYNVAVVYEIKDNYTDADKLRIVKSRAESDNPVKLIEIDGKIYCDFEVKKYEEWEQCPEPAKICENCKHFHHHISRISYPIEVIYCEINKEHHIHAPHPACARWEAKE